MISIKSEKFTVVKFNDSEMLYSDARIDTTGLKSNQFFLYEICNGRLIEGEARFAGFSGTVISRKKINLNKMDSIYHYAYMDCQTDDFAFSDEYMSFYEYMNTNFRQRKREKAEREAAGMEVA